jgi:hypothetical protein
LIIRPQHCTVLQAAAQAEDAAASPEPQQQLQSEQKQKLKRKQETQTRIKRLSAAWKDSSTPNTGLVGITRKSRAESAAACVVADLKTAVRMVLWLFVACLTLTPPNMCQVFSTQAGLQPDS